MKRFLALAIALVSLMILVISPALADGWTVTGQNKKSKSFSVFSTNPKAFLVLSSNPGLANVAQHNFFGKFTKNGNEITHGFYKITLRGCGMNDSFIWAPSATTNKGNVKVCRDVRIYLRKIGKYTITVEPLSNNAASKYWRMDSINKWVHYASWMVSIGSLCYQD